MGGECCAERDPEEKEIKYDNGKIHFISHDGLVLLENEGKNWLRLDCSLDSKDKTAADEFKFHRQTHAKFFNHYKVKSTPENDKAQPLKAFTAHMQELGIGTDSPVVCYDNADGQHACQVACLLSERGVKRVAVYDGDFKKNYDRSDKEQADTKRGAGKSFNFSMQPNCRVETAEFKKLVKGDKVQVVDTTDKVTFDKQSVPKSTQLAVSSVWKNHRVACSNLDLVFDMRSIDKTKQIVFIGDGAVVLKCLADNSECPKTSVWYGNVPDFIAELEKPDPEDSKDDKHAKLADEIFAKLDKDGKKKVNIKDQLVPHLKDDLKWNQHDINKCVVALEAQNKDKKDDEKAVIDKEQLLKYLQSTTPAAPAKADAKETQKAPEASKPAESTK